MKATDPLLEAIVTAALDAAGKPEMLAVLADMARRPQDVVALAPDEDQSPADDRARQSVLSWLGGHVSGHLQSYPLEGEEEVQESLREAEEHGTCKPGETAAQTGCTPALDPAMTEALARSRFTGSVLHEGVAYTFEGGRLQEACVQNRAGPGHHEEESGHPCSPTEEEGPAARQGPRVQPAPRKLRASDKAARAAGKLRNIARRRRVIAAIKREGELALAIRGVQLPDSEPADVVYAEDVHGQPARTAEQLRDVMARREQAVHVLERDQGSPEAHAAARRVLALPFYMIEVKTLLTSPHGVIRMNAAARARKERWEKKYGAGFSVVAIDDRRGGKHSGHRVHVVPGELAGTYRLDQMTRAGDMAEVLRHIRGQ
jgi:hypothetical protein